MERLDQLITVTVRPDLIKDTVITKIEKQNWVAIGEQEKENIRLFLLRRAFEIQQEKSLELLIQQHQSSVILLLDEVYQYHKSTQEPQMQDLYKALLRILEEILSNIEQRFAKYFNQEDKVPEVYLQVSRKEILQKIKPLKKRLKDKGTDEKLIELSFLYINAFATNKTKKVITYRCLMYVKGLIFGMEEICKESVLIDYVMSDLLVYMNFNCSLFIHYYINQIVFTINALPEQKDKVDRLKQFYKQINQLQVKPCVAYKKNNEPVKAQLITWIQEEMNFLEQKHPLFSVAPIIKEDVSVPENDKLQLSISVDVLTLLVRSAKDSKLIMNKQISQMYRSIAKFCSTRNSENPSATSMINKSYTADRSSKKTAIDILHEMIKNINRYCLVPVFVYYDYFQGMVDTIDFT